MALACCTTETGREMDALLDRADSMNRAYIPMTDGIDSLLLEATRYYDRHGDANQQMRAHYLLGCAYRDMGEAPAALQSYQDAIDRADTLSDDCDYPRLMSVYGQMAELFHAQNLPHDELEKAEMYGKYALMIGDTLLYVRNLELFAKPYFLLGDTAAMLSSLQQAQHLYSAYGYHHEAAAIYGTIIAIYIGQDSLGRAKELMDIFESKSGLFDSEGNISHGREGYYEQKGLYYLKTHQLDSAELYFHRLLRVNDYSKNAEGYKGLLAIYKEKENVDSVKKYVRLFEDALYKERADLRTHTVHQMSSLYNYTRHQETARRESEKASAEKTKRQFSIALLILVVAIATWVVYRMSREKRKKQAQYIQNLELLERTQSEILQLRLHEDEFQEMLAEKEKLLEEQTTQLQEQRKKALKASSDIDTQIRESDIYQTLLLKQHGKQLTIQELRDCQRLVLECLPEFNNMLLSKEYKINVKDFQVCMLLRLGFKSKEISNLLNISQGRVSQICTKVLHEVFGKAEGGAAELIEILHKLH